MKIDNEFGPLKVIVNGIEITDSKTWNRVVKSITEKDKQISQLKSELAQHDIEVRKPLEEEIERLRTKETEIEHTLLWRLWFIEKKPTQEELWEFHISYEPCYCCVDCGYSDSIGNECEICGSAKKELRESREEFEVEQLKKLLCVSNKDELIDRLLGQERQKVLDELLEWVEKDKFWTYNTVDECSIFHIYSDALNQKLNDMKGETK